jgi:hypothetical protein
MIGAAEGIALGSALGQVVITLGLAAAFGAAVLHLLDRELLRGVALGEKRENSDD